VTDLLLTRDELQALTGTKQAKRMCDWLTVHGWVFVPPTRRAEAPKVSRAYSEARLASVSKAPPRPLTADEWEAKLGVKPERREWRTPARLDHLADVRSDSQARERAAKDEAERIAARRHENAHLLREQRAALVRHHAGKRRASRLQRTPRWADLDAIRTVYAEARRITVETGVMHHVDHQIPLQGRKVSGLHVHNNLQILTGSENSKKRNRFEPC
jgi:hypothetical protein